jgi:hypothetical protein
MKDGYNWHKEISINVFGYQLQIKTNVNSIYSSQIKRPKLTLFCVFTAAPDALPFMKLLVQSTNKFHASWQYNVDLAQLAIYIAI